MPVRFLITRPFMRVSFALPERFSNIVIGNEAWTEVEKSARDAILWVANNDSCLEGFFPGMYAFFIAALIQYHAHIRRRDDTSLRTLQLARDVVKRLTLVDGDCLVRVKTAELLHLLYSTAVTVSQWAPETAELRQAAQKFAWVPGAPTSMPMKLNPTVRRLTETARSDGKAHVLCCSLVSGSEPRTGTATTGQIVSAGRSHFGMRDSRLVTQWRRTPTRCRVCALPMTQAQEGLAVRRIPHRARRAAAVTRRRSGARASTSTRLSTLSRSRAIWRPCQPASVVAQASARSTCHRTGRLPTSGSAATCHPAWRCRLIRSSNGAAGPTSSAPSRVLLAATRKAESESVPVTYLCCHLEIYTSSV